MRNFCWALFLLISYLPASSQKKPLNHSVYDQWQNIGERILSSDGKWLAYTVVVQEGDGHLSIKSTSGDKSWQFPRCYQAMFSADNRFLVARIKPFFKDTRQARILKKGPNDMPKDSLLILDLEKGTEQRIAEVKSYQMPTKGGHFLAYHKWKTSAVSPRPVITDSLARLQRMLQMADSLNRVSDSLRNKVNEARIKGMAAIQPAKPQVAGKKPESVEEGTELIVRDLSTGKEWIHKLVLEYKFAEFGQGLVIEQSRKNNDSLSEARLLWQDFTNNRIDTILSGFQEAKSFAISEAGNRLAFVIQKDSSAKALKKYYQLYFFETGQGKAKELLNRYSPGMSKQLVISPDFSNYFSQNGKRLFFGLAPDRPVKDTSLVEFETAKLDVWNYKDDYLQPQQLVNLSNELKKSWLAVWDQETGSWLQLADDSCEMVMPGDEGNATHALGMSNLGYRIEQQWKQDGAVRLYLVDIKTGKRKLITERANRGTVRLSPTGNFVLWYDPMQKHWISYSNQSGRKIVITKSITVPLYDEEHDTPSDAPPHGLMGWKEKDEKAYIYDKYDIWELDPNGKETAKLLTQGWGRKNKISIRNEVLDREERFLKDGQPLLFQLFDNVSKGYGWKTYTMGAAFIAGNPATLIHPSVVDGAIKAKKSNELLFVKKMPSARDIWLTSLNEAENATAHRKVSELNPQQQQYNWFTVELHKWKMLDGKMSEGLLYKPENFDASKKYPVIFYFYEKNADRRYNYIEPMPVRASVNIAYYTSNGYLVFDPNIYYKTGQPGEDAYNSVVSAARYLSKFKFVDSTKMGLQGHSWGGYQIAYLITRTNMFAAAEAGAPVSNMTSAYGGIRWGTGISRQFQYEKTQSRLGATLWEKPELYIKNSPLFRADKVKTPLLMLHNDKDDAVPWYQGIEYFTALRRLGKPVWMINYNDELHGINERRNRKDWTIRMAQFFDHYLKGAPAPVWMKEGVPATLKGINWGLDY